MKEIISWFRTLKIAVHCLCEQGYNPERLIDVVGYIESKEGIKANHVINEIRKTIEFHVQIGRDENKKRKSREREIRQQLKVEQRFNKLPSNVQHAMIMESGGNCRKAVDKLAEKGKRYAMRITKKLNKNEEALYVK